MDEGDIGDIGTTESLAIDPSHASESHLDRHDHVSEENQQEKLIEEIQSLQDSLKGLLTQIHQVEREFEKKKAENEMLQTYVNNLTRQNMLITNAK